ncbi:MAG: succinate dehydrogenase/fumarate reductase iron-sulfur subunit [Syntrophus sp. PtaB.Bin138]|nr:MAG: succinate dehydrogenase/fumarate reductase iron-sulfur subunit [Syntrophus sp. PtaB.Bin138]
MNTPLHLAKKEAMQSIGIECANGSAQKTKALELMNEFRKFSRSLSVMLETCTRCGVCAKACHSYLGTEDFNNIPAARAGLMRDIFNRYFSWSGRFFRKFAGSREFDKDTLDTWVSYFYQCTVCRRCAVFCPFGIDTGEIVLAGRNILTRLGIAPGFIVNIGMNELETGNNTGIRKPAIIDSCSFLEEELREETGLNIRIPVDKPQTEILYVPSSSELFTNADSLMGAAKIFHFLGIDWTLSSSLLEAANYGLHFNLDIMKRHNHRLSTAAAEVGATLVIQGECGHGWRAARMYSEGANGPFPYRMTHILPFVEERLADLSFAKLSMRATLHDPCNYARGAGLTESPRAILRECVTDFVEMTPNREKNFCCGGGAGLLMDEMLDIRMRLGKMKAEQIKSLLPLDYVALPCASCKAQVPLLLKHYGMDEIATGGVIELAGKALVMRP